LQILSSVRGKRILIARGVIGVLEQKICAVLLGNYLAFLNDDATNFAPHFLLLWIFDVSHDEEP
jgi:hypothetical protein